MSENKETQYMHGAVNMFGSIHTREHLLIGFDPHNLEYVVVLYDKNKEPFLYQRFVSFRRAYAFLKVLEEECKPYVPK